MQVVLSDLGKIVLSELLGEAKFDLNAKSAAPY